MRMRLVLFSRSSQSLLILRAMKQHIAEGALNVRQSLFGFSKGEISRHELCRRAQSRHESQRGHAKRQNRAAKHSIEVSP